MGWVDFLIIGIVVVSAVVSLFRGFVKEAISLATWVIAFWISLSYASALAEVLPAGISDATVRIGIAFAGLFIVTLVLGGVINVLAGQLVKRTGLSGTDRGLGVVFGLVRGVLVVAVLVLLGALTVMPQEAWWGESLLMPHFERLAIWLRDFLPEDLAAHFEFGP
ncbi:colicin V production CvpA [Thioalkalivibrio denitrificans]|uniref:Colicin V production CvpA n=1 Tax=Thioalkalivibrio denitrificans TaxID=108003 RepID=A0A1V3NBM6_9GAMM|nr:CvpA family protein [Thioalkalivibrio denitrificans]OOG22445.1 colicin V production CvpA [Thioalkalivibrio denitrificans]